MLQGNALICGSRIWCNPSHQRKNQDHQGTSHEGDPIPTVLSVRDFHVAISGEFNASRLAPPLKIPTIGF
jgi:hypothetical protein